MTLTELKYIVAVAREKHFGKAAEACFVSQPTLSVAVKKLEDELELKLFERSSGEITVTALGEAIVRQAQSVLEQAAEIKEIAKRGKDPLGGPLKLGVIYTIGPYLLPELVRRNIERTPQMPLMLQENFTARLLEMLRTGEIDCAILAEPFPDTGLAVAPLYDEPFVAAVPVGHPLAAQASVTSQQLQGQTMLLLGTGHCFRDHVLQVNAAATVRRVRALGLGEVTLIAMGHEARERCVEDDLCRELLGARLRGEVFDPVRIEPALRAAPAARKFFDPAADWAPEGDFVLCSALDVIDFAVQLRPQPEGFMALERVG